MKTVVVRLPKPPKCPPNLRIAQYAVANRRGPSIGKSSWKPGGSAHKVRLVEHVTPKGVTLRWYVDAVTGRRVAPVLHDVAYRSAKKAEHLERLVRNLCWKAEHGGLTVNEVEKLQTLSQDEMVYSHANLVTLIRKALFTPSDAGHVRTHRNAPVIKRESFVWVHGIRVYATGSRTTLRVR